MRPLLLLLLAGCGESLTAAPGELTIVHLRLPGPLPGESTIVVGPDGSLALIDVGARTHDDDVRDAVRALGGRVEWIVITHFHEDHAGALPDLGLPGTVIDRNTVGGLPRVLPLGGATVTILAAAGRVLDGEAPALDGDEDDVENARSLAGVVAWGPFRYAFGGDLMAQIEAPFGERFAPDGADVTHANHHGRRTSSKEPFVAAMAPADGRSRNVVAGIGAAHLGSPQQEVLGAWCDDGRLGEGRFWVTEDRGKAAHGALVDAGGAVTVTTEDAGRGYRIRAGAVERSFPSLR